VTDPHGHFAKKEGRKRPQPLPPKKKKKTPKPLVVKP